MVAGPVPEFCISLPVSLSILIGAVGWVNYWLIFALGQDHPRWMTGRGGNIGGHCQQR